MRKVIALVVMAILCASCSNDQDNQPPETLYPGARLIREVASTTAVLYDNPASDNSCPTYIASYGSNDRPEQVTRFFRNQGFVQQGQGGDFGDVYRWKGLHEGDEATWRKVDIANGSTAGREEWTSVYEVMTPACGTSGG
jgi:hypothetical protein